MGMGKRPSFAELAPALSHETLRALDEQGFTHATPVQAATIPLLCSFKDVAVDAVTGSGKTLAFLVPVVEILRKLSQPLKRFQVGAIIISPTRELASQIFHVAQPFVATLPHLNTALLVGGTDVHLDVAKLQEVGVNILIGTPGRLEDVLERSSFLDVRQLEVLVLDEADRLLDMGFQRQVSAIIGRLPKQRRTGLFSATQTEAVDELAKAGLRNPVRVEVRTEAKQNMKLEAAAQSTHSSKTPATLTIQYLICDAKEKSSQLVQFLKEHLDQKVILYFMTCASVDFWGTVLFQLDGLRQISAVSLHGKMKQSVRERALAAFSSMSAGIMLCTDVAARGLDIPGVDWIVQYDPPQDPNVFVHRVGRTARMGRSGNALVFILPKEDTYVQFLQIRRVPLQEKKKSIDAKDVTLSIRNAARKDRDVMEKGLRAFVSFVRAYKEHHCSYIFRWKELEVGKLAMGYGLLQLPSMPELKRGTFSISDFVPAKGIDLAAIKYRDKSRELQRRRNLAAIEQEKPIHLASKEKVKVVCEGSVLGKKKRVMEAQQIRDDSDDDVEIEEDYRLIQKLKKGKISEMEYAKFTGMEESLADGSLASDQGTRLNKLAADSTIFDESSWKLKKSIRRSKKFPRKLGSKPYKKSFSKDVHRKKRNTKRK